MSRAKDTKDFCCSIKVAYQGAQNRPWPLPSQPLPTYPTPTYIPNITVKHSEVLELYWSQISGNTNRHAHTSTDRNTKTVPPFFMEVTKTPSVHYISTQALKAIKKIGWQKNVVCPGVCRHVVSLWHGQWDTRIRFNRQDNCLPRQDIYLSGHSYGWIVFQGYWCFL